MTRWIAGILICGLCIGAIYLVDQYPIDRNPVDHSQSITDVTAVLAEAPDDPAAYILANFENQTGAENAVAAIYLSYRIYDTMFEALLLLIAIVAIMHFFRIGSPRDQKESRR